MGYDFDDNGIYIGWSPLFKYDDINDLHESERLPAPTGIEYSSYSKEGVDLTFELLELQANNTLHNKINLIKKVGNANKITYNSELVNSKFADNVLKNVINKHTTYKIKDYKESKALNNVTASKISQIIQNLKNMMSAYTPIDMGDPGAAASNSKLGSISKTLLMDTPSATWNMQTQNLDGKQVIGIAAVGEKIFFANCYYFNEGIRSKDPEWLNNMYFYRKFRFLNEDSNAVSIKNLIANINFNKIESNKEYFSNLIKQSIENDLSLTDVSSIIQQDLGFTEDESLVISSLLSAATDNAKELILSKINAGPDLAGVYIHLIMMGFSFKDISNFMTSPSIQLISNLSKTNIYDDYNESITIFNILNDLLEGPNPFKYIGNDNWAYLSKSLGIETSLKKSEILKLLKDRFKDPNKPIEYTNNYKVNRFIEQFNFLQKRRSTINIEYIKEFKYIYSLAQETRLLGSMYGVNQGLKTNVTEKQRFYSMIEGGIVTRENEYKKGNIAEFIESIIEDKPYYRGKEAEIKEIILNADKLKISKGNFSFREFLKNDVYKEVTIKYYNLIKGTWNIFDMITRIPHFKAIYDVVDMVDTYDMNMYNRFNLTDKLKHELTKNSKYKNLPEEQIKAIDNYNSELLIIAWLETLDFNFTIKKGEEYFNKGIRKIAETDINFKIDNDDGRATFKLWFESVVIPALQEGKTDTKVYSLTINKFLQSLALNEHIDDFSKCLIPFYKLPSDLMSSNDPYKLRRYNEILTDFGKLDKYTYQGTNLQDLFILYNFIVNKNKYGRDKLTSIFEETLRDKYSNSLLNQYYKFEGESDYFSQFANVTFELEDVYKKIAPIVSENAQWKSNNKYIRQYDKDSQMYIMKVKVGNTYEIYNPIADATEDNLLDYYSYYTLTAPERSSKLTELTIQDDVSKDTLYQIVKKLIKRNSINVSINCN